MFNMVPGTCASDTTTALLNQAVAGFSDSFFRSSFNCTQEEPVWSGTTDSLDRAIFCGYRQVSDGFYAIPAVRHLVPASCCQVRCFIVLKIAGKVVPSSHKHSLQLDWCCCMICGCCIVSGKLQPDQCGHFWRVQPGLGLSNDSCGSATGGCVQQQQQRP